MSMILEHSKVVDENGEPLVVYHGTDTTFNVFDRTKTRANMDIQGMFFSPWELDAQGYGQNVKAFFLNIKNPATESDGIKALNKFKGQNNAGVKAREYLADLGYDGVNNESEEFIAFDSNQIKSATDNVGTFNESNDIRYSVVSIGNKNVAVANNYDGETDVKAIREYLKNDIGLMATIIETGIEVYIGNDLPNEYTMSKYSQKLQKKQQSKWDTKSMIVPAIQEMIEIATNRRWEKEKHKHKKHPNRFKYGFYRYDSSVAIHHNDRYLVYDVELVIRNDAKGKHFLYDVVNINENVEVSKTLTTKFRQSADMKLLHMDDIKPNSVGDVNTPNSNTENTRASVIADTSYMQARMEGDYDAMRTTLDDVAMRKGYTIKVYHGTRNFGFTTIDPELGDDSFSFFTTTSVGVASTYSGTSQVRAPHEVAIDGHWTK